MPPRKKVKNQNFDIHRDKSCLSSNVSQQANSTTASVPIPNTALADVPEHEELDHEPVRNGFRDPTHSIYSDPDEPGYSQLALEEIAEVTEPEPSGFPGQPDVQSCSSYDPQSLADDSRYQEQSASVSQYTEDQSSHEVDSRYDDGNSRLDDCQIDHGTHYINDTTHDNQTPDASAVANSQMVEEVEQECSLMNHSIDQSYNAEADSQYDITTDSDAATPRRRDNSSSPHEPEDDIFSDRSLRSSVGSYDSGMVRKSAVVEDTNSIGTSYIYPHETMSHGTRPSRPSEISESDGDYSSSSRRTPRSGHYRHGSDLHRKTHLSSPSGSAKSSKRGAITRMGSPSFHVQYSPKGRTPTRFRPQPEEAPLVLLHATMLPLQWNWASILEETAVYAIEGNAILSESVKNLRDAWTLLVDRMGDTVLERGVLLSHPQNDFEVLEERVLEAMELPLRRRARILECGHYLGPANYMSLSDDEETDYDDSSFMSYEAERRRATSTRHWCATCRNEIKVDALGSGRIFRVKVYASNGLMRAGAWEACWREMERVDIEIEPVVDSALHIELAELAAEQQRRAEEAAAAKLLMDKGKEATQGIVLKIDDQTRRMNEERERRERDLHIEREMDALRSQKALPIEAPPVASSRTSAAGQSTFGATLDTSFRRQSMPTAAASTANTTTPPTQQLPVRPMPDTLPGLLFEAARVMLSDRKNIVILVLSSLALVLAFRGGHQQHMYLQMQHEQFPQGYAGSEQPQVQPAEPQVPGQMQYQDVPQVQQYQQAVPEGPGDVAQAEAYRAYMQEQAAVAAAVAVAAAAAAAKEAHQQQQQQDESVVDQVNTVPDEPAVPEVDGEVLVEQEETSTDVDAATEDLPVNPDFESTDDIIESTADVDVESPADEPLADDASDDQLESHDEL